MPSTEHETFQVAKLNCARPNQPTRHLVVVCGAEVSKAPPFRSFPTTKPKDIAVRLKIFAPAALCLVGPQKFSAPAAGGEEAGSFLSLGGVSSDCPTYRSPAAPRSKRSAQAQRGLRLVAGGSP